jgi:hypothetical protein
MRHPLILFVAVAMFYGVSVPSTARADGTWNTANACFLDSFDHPDIDLNVTGGWVFYSTSGYADFSCPVARIRAAVRKWAASGIRVFFEKETAAQTRTISCRSVIRNGYGGTIQWGAVAYSGSSPGTYQLVLYPPANDAGLDSTWSFDCSVPFSSYSGAASATFFGFAFEQ